jgi:predicted transcriptional regulator
MRKNDYLTEEKRIKRKPGCSLYKETAVKRYVSGAMTSLEMERFESHSENCNDCLQLLYQSDVAREKSRNEEFICRTLTLLDKRDEQGS